MNLINLAISLHFDLNNSNCYKIKCGQAWENRSYNFIHAKLDQILRDLNVTVI